MGFERTDRASERDANQQPPDSPQVSEEIDGRWDRKERSQLCVLVKAYRRCHSAAQRVAGVIWCAGGKVP